MLALTPPSNVDSGDPILSFKGMQVEGIYRVNGNQADIGLIEQKVEESEFVVSKMHSERFSTVTKEATLRATDLFG